MPWQPADASNLDACPWVPYPGALLPSRQWRSSRASPYHSTNSPRSSQCWSTPLPWHRRGGPRRRAGLERHFREKKPHREQKPQGDGSYQRQKIPYHSRRGTFLSTHILNSAVQFPCKLLRMQFFRQLFFLPQVRVSLKPHSSYRSRDLLQSWASGSVRLGGMSHCGYLNLKLSRTQK